MIVMSTNSAIKCQAITLKTYDLGEYDKILLLLSKERGIFKAVAKGIKKTKSRFGGKLDPLNINSLLISKGKNLDLITQCENLKSFAKIRNDYDKLVYSLYFGELIIAFYQEGEVLTEIFALLIESLEKLEKAEDALIDVIIFEINLLKMLGYEPDLTECNICANEIGYKKTRIGFSFITGGLICENCLGFAEKYHLLNQEMRVFMQKLLFPELDIEFIPLQKDLENLQKLISNYLSYLSEKKIKTLSVI